MELQEFKDRFIEVIKSQYVKEYNRFDSNKFDKYIEENFRHSSGRYLIQEVYDYEGGFPSIFRTNDKDEFTHLIKMIHECGCLHALNPDYYVYYDLEDNSCEKIKHE